MKKTVLILHGWKIGMTGQRYNEIKTLLEQEGFTVFSPDLPGFGIQELIKNRMTLDDYVSFVKSYLDEKKTGKVILIGHSFGGRIAAKFSYLHPDRIEKLILTGSPLIKKPFSPKQRLANYMAKYGKTAMAIFPSSISQIPRKILYRAIGENDYYESGNLRETFKAIIGEDLAPILSSIKIPTLLIWGDNDSFVPVSIGKEIARKIKHAKLVIIPDTGHKLPYEEPMKFVRAIMSFIS